MSKRSARPQAETIGGDQPKTDPPAPTASKFSSQKADKKTGKFPVVTYWYSSIRSRYLGGGNFYPPGRIFPWPADRKAPAGPYKQTSAAAYEEQTRKESGAPEPEEITNIQLLQEIADLKEQLARGLGASPGDVED